MRLLQSNHTALIPLCLPLALSIFFLPFSLFHPCPGIIENVLRFKMSSGMYHWLAAIVVRLAGEKSGREVRKSKELFERCSFLLCSCSYSALQYPSGLIQLGSVYTKPTEEKSSQSFSCQVLYSTSCMVSKTPQLLLQAHL